MDSSRPRPPAPAEPIPPFPEETVSPKTAVRLGQAIPLVHRAERTARRVARVSAVAGVVLAGALVGEPLRAGQATVPLALVVLALALAPAGLTWLGASMLHDLVTLPSRLRTGAAEAAERARAAVAQGGARGGRIASMFRALWAARGLALDARQGGLRVVALARMVRLASLPFVLLLAVAFALNFAVIGAAVLAVLVRVVF